MLIDFQLPTFMSHLFHNLRREGTKMVPRRQAWQRKKNMRKKLNSSSDIILKHLWQHREVAVVTFCWEDDVCQMNKKSMFKQNWFNVVDFLQSSYMKRDIKSRFEKSIFKCWISFLFSIVIVLRRNSLNVIGLMTECVKW